jgi:alanine-synthesizing transaminase
MVYVATRETRAAAAHLTVFSSRLHWDLRPNPLSELLKTKRAAGASILDLTESNPTNAGLAFPTEEILSALADPRSLRYEPTPTGLLAAREAVADRYYAPLGDMVEPSRILLTASSSEAYAFLIKLLTEPGDELLVPRPSYPLFEFLATLENIRISQYPLIYHEGWSIDTGALARAITERTRAVVLVNPNNPTGSFVKKRELDRLLGLCQEHSLAIISDEVFSDYAFAADTQRVARLTGVDEILTFSLSGLSKVAGLPQMKLGWIVTSGPLSERNAAMERLELIADTYLSVATPVQHALPRLLEAGENMREQIRRRTRHNLDALLASTENSASRTLHVEGGWYATVQVPRIRTEEEWALELLDRCNVLVQPGYFYDFDQDGLLVLSLLTRPDIFGQGVEHALACS